MEAKQNFVCIVELRITVNNTKTGAKRRFYGEFI